MRGGLAVKGMIEALSFTLSLAKARLWKSPPLRHGLMVLRASEGTTVLLLGPRDYAHTCVFTTQVLVMANASSFFPQSLLRHVEAPCGPLRFFLVCR